MSITGLRCKSGHRRTAYMMNSHAVTAENTAYHSGLCSKHNGPFGIVINYYNVLSHCLNNGLNAALHVQSLHETLYHFRLSHVFPLVFAQLAGVVIERP